MIPAAFLLFALIPDLPYGYFQVLRWVVCLFAVYTASQYRAGALAMLFGLIAILFNPLAPIHFEREVWMLIDLACAGVFLFPVFKKSAKA